MRKTETKTNDVETGCLLSKSAPAANEGNQHWEYSNDNDYSCSNLETVLIVTGNAKEIDCFVVDQQPASDNNQSQSCQLQQHTIVYTINLSLQTFAVYHVIKWCHQPT